MPIITILNTQYLIFVWNQPQKTFWLPAFPALLPTMVGVNPDKSEGSAMLENAQLSSNRPNFPSFVSNFQPRFTLCSSRRQLYAVMAWF